MEWLDSLRKQSVKKVLLRFIIFTVIAVAVFVVSGVWAIFGTFSPKTLAELTPETAEGAYVEDDIYFLYGDFIEVERYKDNRPTGTITARYYLVDFDDETYYMGLCVHQEDLTEAEAMMDACNDYMDYATDDPPAPLHVKGTIRAMDEEELDYYYDAVDSDPEITEAMLPVYLDMGRVRGLSGPMVALYLLITLGCLLAGAYPLIKACTGGYQKQVRKTLEASGNLEMAAERAAVFYDSTEPVSGFRLGKEFVFFQYGPKSILLRPWDIAWAYQSTTHHRRGVIPTGTTYAIVLRLMNGKSYTVSMSEDAVKALLQAMETALPGTVLGYSKDLEELYKNQRETFSARWEEKAPGCTGKTE